MDILKFAQIVGKLKRLKRTGWVVNKINNPETVAEHVFRLAILTRIRPTQSNQNGSNP